MTAVRLKVRHVALGVVLAWCATACSPSSQQKAISDTLTAVNAASAAFVAFDAHHQQDLVAQSTTQQGGATALATWRVEQTKVLTLLTAAYRAVAVAATVQSQPNVEGMLAAAALVAQELASLGVRL